MYKFAVALSLLTHLPASLCLPTQECPILGPILPSDFDITQTDAFLNATELFPQQLELLFSSGVLNRTSSSFSIDVFSSVTNTSIYRYNHDAADLHEALTTGELTDNTLFRIGSVSKLFTVYALVVAAGIDIFNDPVTRHLPELTGNFGKAPIRSIIWEDVTVGALASHQAGAGGFILETAACTELGTCNVSDFLVQMRDNKRPTTSAFETPIYADSGFGILARVLERLTGLEYGQAIHSTLSVPLGLNAISTFKPEGDAVNGLIVPGSLAESSWGFDNQITAGSGGIYANGADLRTIGLSILHSQLLSPAATRRWMKPLGNVAALSESVGAPWEINRLALPVTSNSTRTRISDLYTKAGGQAGYGSIFALSPDHNIGFTINVAGATAGQDRWVLRDLVGEIFVVAAEHAAAEYAAQNYVGTFVDDSMNGTNLTVTVEDDKPGLGLASMFWNSTEVRTALVSLQPLPIPAENVTVRLYPSGLRDGTSRVFRAVVEYYPLSPRAVIEGGQGLFNNGCTAWLSAAFYPDSDSLILDIVDGRLESVTSVLFNSTMRRVD